MKFQETFLEKFLVSGFGADSPNIQYTQKKHGVAVLFILSLTVGTAVPNLRFKELLKKLLKNPQKLPTEYTNLFWQKLLRFQRTFPEKSFGSGFGADAPTFNTHKKHGIAVLFIFHKSLVFKAFDSLIIKYRRLRLGYAYIVYLEIHHRKICGKIAFTVVCTVGAETHNIIISVFCSENAADLFYCGNAVYINYLTRAGF